MDRIETPPISQVAVPQPVPDQRPTADAAAVAREPQPVLPMTLAARTGAARGLSQIAEVTRSVLNAGSAADLRPDQQVKEAERTLKPYGIAMLPDSEALQRAREALERAEEAELAADSARAEATAAQQNADRKAQTTGDPESAALVAAHPATAAPARPEPHPADEETASQIA